MMIENEIKNDLEGALCPYLTTCRIIQPQRDKLVKLADRFKEDYCFKNHKGCARRWIKDFLGAEKVPELMMPQQHEWAEQLLFDAGVGYTAFQKKYGASLHNEDDKQ